MRVHLYTIVICTDGAIMFMCPLWLLVANCVIYHGLGVLHLSSVSVQVSHNNRCIYVIFCAMCH